MSVTSWRKPRREQCMTDRYFADYQSEMSSITYTQEADGVRLCVNEKDVDHGTDDGNDAADWIALSELSGKVINRKKDHSGRRLVSTLRQLKQKYLTPMENLSDDDNSGLLAQSDADDNDNASI